MKTNKLKIWGLNSISLVLVLPAAFFIMISVLKYLFGVPGPFDSVAPFLEKAGISEPLLGWNINLLILFGPVLACLISINRVVRFEMNAEVNQFRFQICFLKKWIPLLIIALSALVMAVLILYGLGENCNC